MASLDGKGFTAIVLGKFPGFMEDARELVEVMAGYRENEELELSNRLRRQIEQILEGEGSPAG